MTKNAAGNRRATPLARNLKASFTFAKHARNRARLTFFYRNKAGQSRFERHALSITLWALQPHLHNQPLESQAGPTLFLRQFWIADDSPTFPVVLPFSSKRTSVSALRFDSVFQKP